MENSHSNGAVWKRWGKRGGFALAVVIGILLLIQLLFNLFAKDYLKQKITTAIEASNRRAKATISNLSLFTLNRQIKLEDIKIWRYVSAADTTESPPVSDSLSIRSITLSGIEIYPLIFKGQLALRSITINSPSLYAARSTLSKGKLRKTNPSAYVYQRLKHHFRHPKIDELQINNFSVSVRKKVEGDPIMTIKNFSINFSNILLDSVWITNHPLLPSKKFQGTVDNLRWQNSKYYYLKTGSVWFSSRDSSAMVKDISLYPKIPRYEFSRTAGHEVDRITLEISTLMIDGFDINSLIEDSHLAGRTIEIKHSDLDVFHNKIPPAAPTQRHTFPHLLFRRLDLPISIDSLKISDANITYTEQENLVPKPGAIRFQHTNATIHNLYNYAYSDTISLPITMHATTDIMGTGRLNADFSFPNNTSGRHHITGSLGPMPMEILNRTVENLGSVHIESGKIHALNFDMDIGPEKSKGTLKMYYTGLQIKIIDFDTDKEKNQKQFKSFLTNTFVIKKDNKPPLREGTISYKREPKKSIFNYWWKSLLSGLKSSIGL